MAAIRTLRAIRKRDEESRAMPFAGVTQQTERDVFKTSPSGADQQGVGGSDVAPNAEICIGVGVGSDGKLKSGAYGYSNPAVDDVPADYD